MSDFEYSVTQFWKYCVYKCFVLVQLRKHLRLEHLLPTVTENVSSNYFLSIVILHLVFRRTRWQQSQLRVWFCYKVKSRTVSPRPPRGQRTRECLTVCIVPLISIVPLTLGLQPTTMKLVQLNSPTHASTKEIPQNIPYPTPYVLLLHSVTMQKYVQPTVLQSAQISISQCVKERRACCSSSYVLKNIIDLITVT